MRTLIIGLILGFFLSCDSSVETAAWTPDEIGYATVKSIKEDQRQTFLELFDPKIVAESPAGQLDTAFNFYRNILKEYDLPDYNTWKKERFFWQIDTVNRIMAIGLPLINSRNTQVDFIFEMKYGLDGKLIGINLNKTQDASLMPDYKFPPRETEFKYSIDSLVSIRLYYLPGINSNPQLSKSIEFKSPDFNAEIRNDFGSILSNLNNSKILSAGKINSQQPSSNDLKAVIFVFRDNGQKRNVFLIKNNIAGRELEINMFYEMNATYSYQIDEASKTLLRENISLLVDEYVK